MRARYPGRPWLDVRTKADLPLADEVPPGAVPLGTLNVSVLEDTNVVLLKQRMARLVGDPEEEEATSEAAGLPYAEDVPAAT